MVWDEHISDSMEWRLDPRPHGHFALESAESLVLRYPVEPGIPAVAEIYLVNADTTISQTIKVSAYDPEGTLIVAPETQVLSPNGVVATSLGQLLGLPPTVKVGKILAEGQGRIAGLITGSRFVCAAGGCAAPPLEAHIRAEASR
jgi:hypothetical protein